MHGTTLKFRSNLDANWQRKSRARSSLHYRARITFCWNKIRQRSAFSKRSTYFSEARIRDNVRFGSKADIVPLTSRVGGIRGQGGLLPPGLATKAHLDARVSR